MAATPAARKRIPRDPENDYTREAAEVRQAFVAEHTGAVLEHVSSYSFDPSVLQGNVENFTGAAQVPQRECLELLGCYGSGKVNKLADIVAATVLCGELSLGSAIVAEQWVEAHDLHGRNRP